MSDKYIDVLLNQALQYETENNYSKAFFLYNNAYKYGYKQVCSRLGLLYINGVNFKLNFELAEKYFIEGIESQHHECLFNLAQLYFLDNKESQALKYFNEAANHNITEAQYFLANYYFEKKQMSISLNYYKLLYNNGHKDVACKIANILETTDRKTAYRLYCEAAAKDVAEAIFKVGFFIIEGYLIGKTIKQGIELVKLSISKGYDYGNYYLGKFFLENKEFNNVSKSIKYLEKSIEKGNVDSLHLLAKYYIEVNSNVGLNFIKKAATFDCVEAQLYLKKLEG